MAKYSLSIAATTILLVFAILSCKSTMNTLWDLATEKANQTADESKSSEDNAVFIIGGKNSGKTSIILRFLDRTEPPKPTVALEYTYGRRSKGHNIAKDVGHIWELGGGTWLSKLMDIPLNPDTLLNTTLFIVVDLSQPGEMWYTLETLLAAARSRIETIIGEMKRDYPNIRDTLKRKAWENYGEENPDKSMVDPFPIPLVILGGKYDVFQDFDSEKRKVICKTLRFVAHSNGATLQFFSTKIENLVTRVRALITHHLFGTQASKTVQQEHNKPLSIPAGLDSLQHIGTPPIADKDIGRINAKRPVDLWKHAFTGHFPQTDTNNPSLADDPAKDPKYAEPAIDALRAQKDEELERYRRLSERRAKQQHAGYDDA